MKKRKGLAAIAVAAALMLSACGNTETEAVEDEVSKALTEETVTEESTTDISETSEEDSSNVEDPDETLMTDNELDGIAMETSEGDDSGNVESVHDIADQKVNTQIVFLGDSIFDSVRDETGIARQVGENLEADVYNLDIGGTTAALRKDKSTNVETWTEPSLMGVVYTMTGDVSKSIYGSYKAGEVFDTCDFSKTNYFIIEYGTNDFLNYIPLGSAQYNGDYYFYFRTSLDMAVNKLNEAFPNAKIILCTPYYEEYWSADKSRYIGDCHTVNNGYGYLLDYVSVLQDVAKDHNLTCLNMYNLLDVNQNNVNDMTVDGIHPSEQTRNKYAELLTTAIKEIESTGTTTLDWQAQEAAKAEAEAAAASSDQTSSADTAESGSTGMAGSEAMTTN